MSIRSEKLGSNTKQMKTKEILRSRGQSLKKSTMIPRFPLKSRILVDKKNGSVCHAYLLPLLKIPMFKNYLMFLV